MTVFQVILAVLLPPIAVATRYGLRGAFVLSVLLTVLGRVPGVIHAFIMLTRTADKPAVKKKSI